jgi:hypothetical protein
MNAEGKLTAAIEFIRRAGAREIQFRYAADERPVVWLVVADCGDGSYEVEAALRPDLAALRLCERLAAAGACVECGRPTALTSSAEQTTRIDRRFCGYTYDTASNAFVAGCTTVARDDFRLSTDGSPER